MAAAVPVVDSQGRVPSGQRGVLPWSYTATFGDGYCPACASSRDWLPERADPSEDGERCAGCGCTAGDLAAAQLEAFRDQQREWARHAVNPITEDGQPLPSGIRGLIRVF